MRKSLEELIFLGRLTREVIIFGKKWVLSTLEASEQKDATSATSGLEPVVRVLALKMEILARSLTKIDDMELNSLSEKLDFIKKLQMPLIDKLFSEYEKLLKEQEEIIGNPDELKN